MKYAPKYIKWVVCVVWMLLCIWSLQSYISHERAWMDSELLQLVYMKIMLLTFPSGYLVVVAGYFLSSFLKPILSFNLGVKLEFYLTCFFMLSTGFLQWFFLLPWLIRKTIYRKEPTK